MYPQKGGGGEGGGGGGGTVDVSVEMQGIAKSGLGEELL